MRRLCYPDTQPRVLFERCRATVGVNRRTYLAVLGAASLAGCVGGDSDGVTATEAAGTGTLTGGDDGDRPRDSGVSLPVPDSELTRGAPKDAIPAITDPEFAPDWSDVEIEQQDPQTGEARTLTLDLSPDDRVIGVERDGTARAYPLRILNWHEVVNDSLGGPLLVTFCPLCGSGMTAVRRVDGEESMFGVSGMLWRSDLVMYDEATDSRWSQIMATAIQGPMVGAELELVPSTMTTWGTWRESHPETAVLLPPPFSHTVKGESTRNYGVDPYGGYANTTRIGIGANSFDDDRLHPKTTVIGVRTGGEARAYPLPAVESTGVVNDTVGGTPVVVAVGPDDTLVAYERTVDGETLTFRADDGKHRSAGGSRWEIATGRAVDGPHEGTTLAPANDASPMFWFAWLDFNPETTVYGLDEVGTADGQ